MFQNVDKATLFTRFIGLLSPSEADANFQDTSDPSSRIESLEEKPVTPTLLQPTSVRPGALPTSTAVPPQAPIHSPVVVSPMDSSPSMDVPSATCVKAPVEVAPMNGPPIDTISQAPVGPGQAVRRSSRTTKKRQPSSAVNSLSTSQKRPSSSTSTVDQNQNRDPSASVKRQKQMSIKGQIPSEWNTMTDLPSFMCTFPSPCVSLC